MVFPLVNFPFNCSVEEANSHLNVGLEEGFCDSTYLGKIEIPVEIEEPDEDERFFGTHIREVINLFKLFKRKK
jgi:hypothetical protein